MNNLYPEKAEAAARRNGPVKRLCHGNKIAQS